MRGKTIVKIDKWFPSSQIRSYCDTNTGKKALSIRKFDCPYCGRKDIDRDINAAINIKNYGLNQINNTSMAVTIGIQACWIPSILVANHATGYDTMKQETQQFKRSLAIV